MDTPPTSPFPSLRHVLAWLALVGGLAFGLNRSWHYYDDDKRPDGNCGHTLMDFGGQWLMGRLLVEGQARHLYDRNRQRRIVTRAYPRGDGAADEKKKSDAEQLMGWLMGVDNPEAARTAAGCAGPLAGGNALGVAVLLAGGRQEWTEPRLAEVAADSVGGALYPPINAFVYAPLGLLSPRPAYRLAQVVNVVLIFVCGWAVVCLSGGRVWWPVATLLLMAFPGFGGCLNLAQNSSLSLAILLWGWVLLARGHEGRAGVVWGLLAFKPVWGLAFFLVPLLTGRWRMAAAMAATGTALALATLPVVGPGVWLNWLKVGREASALYAVDHNWIEQSRDLLGAGRRWMLDFDREGSERGPLAPAATLVGWGLFAAALATTVWVTLRHRRAARQTEGPAAAFVFLGAWLSCYHFIYYDTLLAALPVALLFLEPRRHFRSHLRPRLSVPLVLAVLIVVMPNVSFFVPQLQTKMDVPWDQYLLVLLWLWCGWSLVRQASPDLPVNRGTMLVE